MRAAFFLPGKGKKTENRRKKLLFDSFLSMLTLFSSRRFDIMVAGMETRKHPKEELS